MAKIKRICIDGVEDYGKVSLRTLVAEIEVKHGETFSDSSFDDVDEEEVYVNEYSYKNKGLAGPFYAFQEGNVYYSGNFNEIVVGNIDGDLVFKADDNIITVGDITGAVKNKIKKLYEEAITPKEE